jgi:carbamoyl-phosphate synthase large subunit
LDPHSFDYFVIEVNPRVSRSSALASKATGYPIARVASKIAIGLLLEEIPNAVTQKTPACFEPALDYCIVKIPRWPFDKFSLADRRVTTQMKATGEVMALGRSFEEALLKAMRSLEMGQIGLRPKNADLLSEMDIEGGLEHATDERLFIIFEALYRGMSIDEIHQLTHMDRWFLDAMDRLMKVDMRLRALAPQLSAEISPEVRSMVAEAKQLGFGNRHISDLLRTTEAQVAEIVKLSGMKPVYKMVDTCAAEFEAATPYFYSCFDDDETESIIAS